MLTSGSHVGPYRVVNQLGAGAMGEVWRARDSRLGREVALKVITGELVADDQRHARFEREAQLLAALNHPNIATLYGLEHVEGIHVLVMELVEGEGLDQRLARGAIPAPEVAQIALQIAEALEAAHEAGVVHRDLKPANIRIRPDGTVKVLDFGLAKARGPSTDGSLSLTATLTQSHTMPGAILGTAAYMSPEQAGGQEVDRRADVWAFGAVVWEMLTGTALFSGETVSDVFAAVLTREPEWAVLARDHGAEVETVLRRCLARDPRQRFSSAHDAGLLLAQACQGKPPRARDASGGWLPGRLRGAVAAALVLAGLAVGAGVMAWLRRPASPAGVVRLSLLDASMVVWSGIALSPDGRRLAFVQGLDRGTTLAVRNLDAYDAVALPGTEGATAPFFSPDGQWLGYFTRTELRKVPVAGGSPRGIASLAGRVRFDPWSRSPFPTADWGRDDTIVFSSGFWREPATLTGLFTVPAVGGEPQPLTTLDGTELGHRWPRFTPDGDHVVFTAVGRGPRNQHIDRVDLAGGRRIRLHSGLADGRLLVSGSLVALDSYYTRLVAVPMNRAGTAPLGPPVPLVEGISNEPVQSYALSANGSLVYVASGGGEGERRLVRAGFDGTVTTLVERRGTWFQPRSSPGGRFVAVREIGEECRIWVLDLQRQTLTPLTQGGDNHQPVWTADGRAVAFGREDVRLGVRGIFSQLVDGSGEARELLGWGGDRLSTSLSVPYPSSFSPVDSTLLFEQSTLGTGSDLWLLSGDGGEPQPLLATPAFEGDGAFSPDGRWIAYVSDESGRQEVYVRGVEHGGRMQISSVGGEWPIWSRDGKRLYFAQFRRVMGVDFDGQGGEPVVGRPEVVLAGFEFVGRGAFDLMSDGASFVVIQPAVPGSVEVRVVLGWERELTR
ncbi:MAG: serine/threonine-protein kinase [Acidobacteriota bacterium]|jgi:serine/threonine-protein kinase